MKPFLIATGNPGKFNEITSILGELPYEFLSIKDLEGVESQVEEHGTTHDENALIKARHFFNEKGYVTLGEDSGIEVAALKDELGLHTRRWGAGANASDEEWLDFFMKRMERESNRAARFVCSAALILEDGSEHLFHGEARGAITRDVEAPILPGLPLSSVFKVEGYDCVYAGMSKMQKAEVSHRGWAISKVKSFLEERT